MNICVLNGSPRGAYSTTLHTVLYLQKRYPRHSFEVIHVGTKIRALEQDMTAAADAVFRLIYTTELISAKLSAPVIKCKKTPEKKCSFVGERRKKR